MMIFAYNHSGVIITEFHMDKVSQDYIIVLSFKIWIGKYSKPDLIARGWLILQNNACLHIAMS